MRGCPIAPDRPRRRVAGNPRQSRWLLARGQNRPRSPLQGQLGLYALKSCILTPIFRFITLLPRSPLRPTAQQQHVYPGFLPLRDAQCQETRRQLHSGLVRSLHHARTHWVVCERHAHCRSPSSVAMSSAFKAECAVNVTVDNRCFDWPHDAVATLESSHNRIVLWQTQALSASRGSWEYSSRVCMRASVGV